MSHLLRSDCVLPPLLLAAARQLGQWQQLPPVLSHPGPLLLRL
jgi:hypothetical protein